MAATVYDTSVSLKSLSVGIDKLANCVRPTLGPRGRNVAFDQKFDVPLVVNTGNKILKDFHLEDPLEDVSATILKAVAMQTNGQAGDGTTATIVLAQSIFNGGIKNIAAGADPLALRRGIEMGVSVVLEHLYDVAQPAADLETIRKVTAIAAGSDASVGELLGDAFEKVGLSGIITVEDSQLGETELIYADGATFEKGYLSPYFINNDRKTCELQDPYILVCNSKIEDPREILNLLREIKAQDASLLIIAREISQEVLGMLSANSAQGVLKVAAVVGPGHGDTRRRNMMALAALHDAVLMEDNNGLNLKDCGLEVCGRAKKAVIEKERTVLRHPYHSRQTEVDGLRAMVKKQLTEETDEFEIAKLQETLAVLNGGIATIRVGGVSELEMFEKKFRIDNGLRAAYAALESGVVPGGGLSLLEAIPALEELKQTLEGDESTGTGILQEALKAPARQIAENAGEDGRSVVARILASDRVGYGYDAASGEFCDFARCGIYDPLKTVCLALEHAASAAATLFTTGAIVLKD